jgi:hypothetical protein
MDKIHFKSISMTKATAKRCRLQSQGGYRSIVIMGRYYAEIIAQKSIINFFYVVKSINEKCSGQAAGCRWLTSNAK